MAVEQMENANKQEVGKGIGGKNGSQILNWPEAMLVL